MSLSIDVSKRSMEEGSWRDQQLIGELKGKECKVEWPIVEIWVPTNEVDRVKQIISKIYNEICCCRIDTNNEFKKIKKKIKNLKTNIEISDGLYALHTYKEKINGFFDEIRELNLQMEINVNVEKSKFDRIYSKYHKMNTGFRVDSDYLEPTDSDRSNMQDCYEIFNDNLSYIKKALELISEETNTCIKSLNKIGDQIDKKREEIRKATCNLWRASRILV